MIRRNMTKKKFKKSTLLTVGLLIYVSLTAAYLLPRNAELSYTEKCVTLAVSYVIVVVLWLVLRKKEQLKEKRDAESKTWKEDHYSQLNKQ